MRAREQYNQFLFCPASTSTIRTRQLHFSRLFMERVLCCVNFFLFVCHLFVLVACRLNRMISIVVGCICDLLLLLFLFLFSCSSLFGSRVFNLQTVYYWIDFCDELYRRRKKPLKSSGRSS